MTDFQHSALYEGLVVHQRVRPRRHRLSYRVFSMLLDLDEIGRLDTQSPLFGHNRRAIVSFWNRDHGDGSGRDLRSWVHSKLIEAGLQSDGGTVRVLCYPRIFGYAFNPLTVYFCYCRDGVPIAVLYEVRNTFNERHTYVIPVIASGKPVIRQSCDKVFYVSPFAPMDCTYHFRILPPDKSVAVAIRQEDANGLLLTASFNGQRKPLTSAALVGALVRYPAMIFKVTMGIHWEALRLLLKRLPVYPHRAAETPTGTSTIQIAASRREAKKVV